MIKRALSCKRGLTLIETVIAMLIIAVASLMLLSGFTAIAGLLRQSGEIKSIDMELISDAERGENGVSHSGQLRFGACSVDGSFTEYGRDGYKFMTFEAAKDES